MWQELVEKLREKATEGRALTYTEGAIGITALLNCPLKWDLSKAYDIKPETVEIDDGFVWEKQVKSALRELYADAVEEEKDLLYEVDGHLLHGHLDVFIEREDEVIGIELKAPKFIQLRGMPQKIDRGLFIDEDGLVLHNPVYLKQAQIQKFLLERLYPDKRVRQYLFYKGLARYRAFSMKLYVVSEVKESITEDELINLVKAFYEDKRPRYPDECERYCIFYKEGLCEGMPSYREEKKEKLDLFMDYLREYRRLQGELKTIESYMKKLITGSVLIAGKRLGWAINRTFDF